MQTRKLRVRLEIEHDLDRTSRLFGPVVDAMLDDNAKLIHRLLIASLRNPEHSSLWGGAHMRISLEPELIDDSAGVCCATCKYCDLEGDVICRYNQSIDVTKACDFHEWADELCVRLTGHEDDGYDGEPSEDYTGSDF